MRSTLRTLQHSWRGFTLLELIVTIVVLGVLAALAIPTFAGVITRTHDEVARTEVSAYGKQAWAVAAFDGDKAVYAVALFNNAYSSALAPGTLAAEPSGLTLTGQDPVGTPSSEKHGKVSLAIKSTGDKVRLAMRSNSGHCVFYEGHSGNQVYNTVHKNVGTGECIATFAGTQPWPLGVPTRPNPPKNPPKLPPTETSAPTPTVNTCDETTYCTDAVLNTTTSLSSAHLGTKLPSAASAVSIDAARQRVVVSTASHGLHYVTFTGETGVVNADPKFNNIRSSIIFHPGLYFYVRGASVYRYDLVKGTEVEIFRGGGYYASEMPRLSGADVVGSTRRVYVTFSTDSNYRTHHLHYIDALRTDTTTGSSSLPRVVTWPSDGGGSVHATKDHIYLVSTGGYSTWNNGLYRIPKDSLGVDLTQQAHPDIRVPAPLSSMGNTVVRTQDRLIIAAGSKVFAVDEATGATTHLFGARYPGETTGDNLSGFVNSIGGMTAYRNKIYVTDYHSGQVLTLAPSDFTPNSSRLVSVNLPTGSTMTEVPALTGATSLVADNDGKTLYASTGVSSYSVYDNASQSVTATRSFTKSPYTGFSLEGRPWFAGVRDDTLLLNNPSYHYGGLYYVNKHTGATAPEGVDHNDRFSGMIVAPAGQQFFSNGPAIYRYNGVVQTKFADLPYDNNIDFQAAPVAVNDQYMYLMLKGSNWSEAKQSGIYRLALDRAPGPVLASELLVPMTYPQYGWGPVSLEVAGNYLYYIKPVTGSLHKLDLATLAAPTHVLGSSNGAASQAGTGTEAKLPNGHSRLTAADGRLYITTAEHKVYLVHP